MSKNSFMNIQNIVTSSIILQTSYFTIEEISNLVYNKISNENASYTDSIIIKTIEILVEYEVILRKDERYHISKIIYEYF